jgi:ABC-type amino acid transport system permease subunit
MTVFGREYRERLWALAGAACTLSLAIAGVVAGLTLGGAAAQASVTPGFGTRPR